MSKIPEMINDSRTYVNDNADYYPTTEFEPPEVAALTAEITGVGLAGKIDAPVEGQVDSTEAKLTMRVPTKETMALVAGRPISMENYADIQNFDSGTNSYAHTQMRTVMRGRVKSVNPGTIQRGETTDTEVTAEIHYYKVEFDGKVACEIDKFGYKAIVDGVDLLADIRTNIGM